MLVERGAGDPRASSPRSTSRSWRRSRRTGPPRRAPRTARWPATYRARGSAASGRLRGPAAAEGRGRGERDRRARAGRAGGDRVGRVARRAALPPPLLFDLTELQRHANRLYGFSAKKTLEVAQALYEEKKLDHLPAHRQPPPLARRGRDAAARWSRRSSRPVRGRSSRRGPARGRSAGGSWTTRRSTDHHAIIPTAIRAAAGPERRRAAHLRPRLPPAARGLARRPRLRASTTVVTAIESGRGRGPVSRPRARRCEQAGWKVLDRPVAAKVAAARKAVSGGDDDGEAADLPPGLDGGQPQEVVDGRSAARRRHARRSASPTRRC